MRTVHPHLGDEEDVTHRVTHGTTQSVPHARGKEKKLSHGVGKKTKVGIRGGKVSNSDPEVGKKHGDVVPENGNKKFYRIQTSLFHQPTLTQNKPGPQLNQNFSKCQNKPVAQLNLRMNVARVASYQKEESQKRPMEVDSARPRERAVPSHRSVRELTAMFEDSKAPCTPNIQWIRKSLNKQN